MTILLAQTGSRVHRSLGFQPPLIAVWSGGVSLSLLLMLSAGSPVFQPTRWSLITAAKDGAEADSRAAMDTLCRAYWYPIYAYVRGRGTPAEDALDLTQSFFARVIEKEIFAKATPDRGKLRSFLLNACQNFLVNEWHKGRTDRRGGGRELLSLDAGLAEGWFAAEPATALTPEALYHRRWALAVLEQALGRLREEYEAAGKGEWFAAVKSLLEDDGDSESQRALSARLGMSEGALRVAVFRMRKRYREVLFSEVAQGLEVSTEEEVKQELAVLIAAL